MSTLSQIEANDLLKVVDVTTSTNDDAREAARAGALHGSAVAAHVQTAGRGRRGHVWESPRGSLYLSCVLRPSVPMHFFTGLPAVCALGVLDCLRDDLGIAQAALKWPNDIIAGSSKLAGILGEAGSSAMGTFAVCGVGVNVASTTADTAPQAVQVTPEADVAPSPRPWRARVWRSWLKTPRSSPRLTTSPSFCAVASSSVWMPGIWHADRGGPRPALLPPSSTSTSTAAPCWVTA